ncbi:YhgE/Pip domain-containing protein [Solibacillus sp. FSL H8-0538]|uniref:YhgE/Pip domain-containing protein n=1 Tax=Solibacillus sp. FSL H8-0538 TaxID=2921400 RepID=UPI0030FA6CC0
MKKNKFLMIPFVAVLVLLFIFVSTQIPGAHQSVKNLPIAFVIEDNGEMSNSFVKTVQENSKAMQAGDEPMIKWIILNSQQEMKKEMANQNLYGAIVIPADFTEKYLSLQTTTPSSPELQVTINQGKNSTVATVVSQTLSSIVTQMNHVISNQLLSTMEQNKVPLTVEQARIYAAPIKSTTTMLHETGTLGNAPLSLFQPLWIASIASAVMLWLAGKNRVFTTLAEKLKFKLVQILVAIALGFVAGFSLTWYTTFILDYEYTSFVTIAIFLAIACISFILLISAFLSWIGIASITVFVLLMFFGLPLLQLAPEMLPDFYRDWIYPWLPMRFLFDGVREILFYNGAMWNGAAIVLFWIAVVSSFIHLAKALVPTKQEVSEI